MSKIANAIEYYDIFLENYTKKEAMELFKKHGIYEWQCSYDQITNSISIFCIEDPSKIIHDITFKEEAGKHKLIL